MNYETPILNERESPHGDYKDTARIAVRIKTVLSEEHEQRLQRGQRTLSFSQAESLDLIATKIGRIISGDPDNEEHWDDIAGYAKLISERIRAEKVSRPFNPSERLVPRTTAPVVEAAPIDLPKFINHGDDLIGDEELHEAIRNG